MSGKGDKPRPVNFELVGSDVNFITDDDTGVSSTLIETTTTVNIYKYQIF